MGAILVLIGWLIGGAGNKDVSGSALADHSHGAKSLNPKRSWGADDIKTLKTLQESHPFHEPCDVWPCEFGSEAHVEIRQHMPLVDGAALYHAMQEVQILPSHHSHAVNESVINLGMTVNKYLCAGQLKQEAFVRPVHSFAPS